MVGSKVPLPAFFFFPPCGPITPLDIGFQIFSFFPPGLSFVFRSSSFVGHHSSGMPCEGIPWNSSEDEHPMNEEHFSRLENAFGFPQSIYRFSLIFQALKVVPSGR